MTYNKKHKYFLSKKARIIILTSSVASVIAIIQVDIVLLYFSEWFKYILEVPRLFDCIMGICIVLSILHFIFVPKAGMAREHLLYKRFGPILSIPLTCATHGIFIYCGLQLIYIVGYDENTLVKYKNIDKTTIVFTMLAISYYSVYSLFLIVSDIIDPKVEEAGKVISNNASPENIDENPKHL